jgi:hypothetical protein
MPVMPEGRYAPLVHMIKLTEKQEIAKRLKLPIYRRIRGSDDIGVREAASLSCL